MNRKKVLLWSFALALGAGLTGYLFHVDDWQEKHTPGYQSTDSVQLIIGVFTCYTLLLTGVFGSIAHLAMKRYPNRPGR